MSVQNDVAWQIIPITVRPEPVPADGWATVYRFYDGAGELLYIGSTCQPPTRWSQHKSTKEWWPTVAAYTMTWYPSREDAYAEEYKAIREEAPKHNTLGVFPFGARQPMTEAALRVIDALEALEEIPDPQLRDLAFSQVSADLATRGPRFKEQRRQLVLSYRAEGVSYRKIATYLGVSLGAVQDIVRGHSGAWGTKPRGKREEGKGSPDGE